MPKLRLRGGENNRNIDINVKNLLKHIQTVLLAKDRLLWKLLVHELSELKYEKELNSFPKLTKVTEDATDRNRTLP